MRVSRTSRFKKSYQKLNSYSQELVDKALTLLVSNADHPSLNTRKLQPRSRGLWYCRASSALRITFTRTAEGIVLYDVGPHDIL